MQHDPAGPRATRFGIYVNAQEGKAVRINSPYWFPEEPEWVFLTAEVNATLLQIRQLAGEQGLVDVADALTWGTLPQRD